MELPARVDAKYVLENPWCENSCTLYDGKSTRMVVKHEFGQGQSNYNNDWKSSKCPKQAIQDDKTANNPQTLQDAAKEFEAPEGSACVVQESNKRKLDSLSDIE